MAQFSFQKIAEDTSGKDIQEVQDWWTSPGIMKGTNDVLELQVGVNAYGDSCWKKRAGWILTWVTQENQRENNDTGHLEWIFIETKPDFTNYSPHLVLDHDINFVNQHFSCIW